MNRWRVVWMAGAGLLMLLVVTGCGGNKRATPLPSPVPTATEVESAAIATASPVFPPTWTPQATLTEPPRVTIAYTYVAPTVPTFVPPTYTPTPITPTPKPPGPTLLITLDDLNRVIVETAEMYYIRGRVDGLTISIEDDGLVLTGTHLGPPGEDPLTMRPFVLKATVGLNEGRAHLDLTSAAYTDAAGGALDIGQANAVTTEVENTLADMLIEAYQDTGGQKFYINELYVTPDGITCATVSLD